MKINVKESLRLFDVYAASLESTCYSSQYSDL